MTHETDEEARMKQIADMFGEVYDRAVTNRKVRDNTGGSGEYAKVSDVEADRLQAETGMDFHGWTHYYFDHDIRHGHKRHGIHKEKELAMGQIPITREDFQRIYDVIKNADDIRLSDKLTDTGQPAIEYRKQVNGYYLVVEEVRSPRTKRLALKSILRKKGNWKNKKAAD